MDDPSPELWVPVICKNEASKLVYDDLHFKIPRLIIREDFGSLLLCLGSHSSFIPAEEYPMAYKAVDSTSKKLIQIDISSDTVCPWCFVGKKNLEKAISLVNEQYNFEVRWHPFFLNPNAPKEGIKKSDYYKEKFGASKSELILSRMKEVFRGLGFEYDTAGLTGSTLDSHRLISFAAGQGYGKQNELVEELFQNYFVQGKYIGDNQVLLDAANKVGIERAAELINDPSKGLKEVNEELQTYSSHITGVPHFLINGSYQLSGGQPPEVFLRAFELACK
ncbi:hypothetical protein HPP92_012260 [Vanilla planifolia]|uniref:DSBA-like thioredoxin domain-containing protein n=1 Tax=Vanilla planifolia TaxID=51239 RepID=A0A835V0Z0_VANPL|nr:hypothetical protein HPP92_012260 [Vanilla planifolia]